MSTETQMAAFSARMENVLHSLDLGKVSCLWPDRAEGLRYVSENEFYAAVVVCVPDLP